MKRLRSVALCCSLVRPTVRPLLLVPRRAASTAAAAAVVAPPLFPAASSATLPLAPSRNPLASAKLPALHARLSLDPRFPLQTLARSLIDPSADADRRFNNEPLATLGNTLTGYYASEYFMTQYPRLPAEVLYAAVGAYVGSRALAAVGREWGIEPAAAPTAEVDAGLLQFKRYPPGTPPTTLAGYEGATLEQAMAAAVRAVFGGVYLHEGIKGVRQFFRQHILSRKLEVEKLFDFRQPTRELSRLCAREGFEPPVARLLSETGRFSRHAVFVVGVYSGPEKMGEGHGGSLDEARIRAAVNALKGWYLYRPLDAEVPSKTDGDPDATYRPAVIDAGEVIV